MNIEPLKTELNRFLRRLERDQIGDDCNDFNKILEAAIELLKDK